ncbi:MAG: hypothetical protein JNN15_10410 [Blastocatellia bacterium]|nr:hypothetical protein [Blastocatellia bacterium]
MRVSTLLLALLFLAGCANKSAPPANTDQQIDSSSNVSQSKSETASKELQFLKRFKIGQSLDEVKSRTSDVELKKPTNELPIGELPEDQIVVEFNGNVSGYFYFEGTENRVGKLIMVEVFTDNKSYENGLGKQRIEAFTALLGKPTSTQQDDEDGVLLYSAEWRKPKEIIRYADIYEWGSSISLSTPED